MKAPARLFANVRQVQLAARFVACAGVYALTTACGGNLLSETTIDPKSPIAAEAAKMAKANAAFPKFSDIPAVPTDVRRVDPTPKE